MNLNMDMLNVHGGKVRATLQSVPSLDGLALTAIKPVLPGNDCLVVVAARPNESVGLFAIPEEKRKQLASVLAERGYVVGAIYRNGERVETKYERACRQVLQEATSTETRDEAEVLNEFADLMREVLDVNHP
jgi:hypothetical protein